MLAPKAGITLATITLLLAGCGGGSAAPGTTTRTGAQLDPQKVAHLEAFAACMRAHGVAHLPAVNGNGRPGANGSGQVDLKSPAVKAAIKTCLPTADGAVGANLQPVGVTRTAPRQAPAAHQSATAPNNGPLDCDSVTTCYMPRQIEAAYGIRLLLERGIDGRGETVVLPELAETQLLPPVVSDLRQDMSRFDSLFGLPAARLKVVTSIASSASPWLANGEEVLDAENVHAVAPDAAITVVLVKPTSLNNPANAIAAAVAAVRVGVSEGSVISISAAGQTGGEHCDTRTEVERLNRALEAAAARRVTVIAASGDIGAVGEPCAVIKGLTGGAFPPVKEVNLPAADARPSHGRHQPQRQPRHRHLHQRDRLGPPVRKPRNPVPGLRRRIQPPLLAARLPERRARHGRHPRGTRRVRRRLAAHRHDAGHRQRRQPIHHPQQRRHQR